MAHLEFDFPFAVGAYFFPALFAVKAFGPCTWCSAQPNGMGCLAEIPMEHTIVQCFANTHFLPLGMKEKSPDVVVLQVGDGKTGEMAVCFANPALPASGNIVKA